MAAAEKGRKIYFGRLTELFDSLQEAKAAGQPNRRLETVTSPALLVVDEIGYLPVPRSGGPTARHPRTAAALPLGSVIPFSLAQAREMAQANRKLVRGGDPLAEKRRAYGIPSCAVATERLVEQERSGWREPRHGGDWMARRHAFPRRGRTPVSVVTSDDVLEILGPICIWPRRLQPPV